LLVFFLLSLPLVNPIVHGDGVGYYAYARALLIRHDLQFEEDWRHANLYFTLSRTLPGGQLREDQYTPTGHVSNRFSVGPAMLWSPFLLLAHAGVLMANAFGKRILADGFSTPYLITMSVGTAFYGFLGLLFSYLLARKYVEDRWAFLATLGAWLASSLPVYMYFNPAWSHAHSAFTVALYLWFWDRTRASRTTWQWILLGLLSGLMIDVYFLNAIFLLLPLTESLVNYLSFFQTENFRAERRLFAQNVVCLFALLFAVSPTLITRRIIFGGFFRFGPYAAAPWDWSAPHWCSVLFSSDHGLLTWTPILLLAIAGLFFATHQAKVLALYFGAVTAVYYYVISSYPYWDGMSSFGNRFFISLTPIFVFGLALFFARFAAFFRGARKQFIVVTSLIVVLALWNAGFMVQWGTHLVPARGPISFRAMAHNQFFVLPRELATHLRSYMFGRNALMHQIEERDIQEMNKPSAP
jgi:hypothetical protein